MTLRLRLFLSPLLALALALVFVPVHGHFFWAETNPQADRVTVTFSEKAGVPDPVLARFGDRLTNMSYTGAIVPERVGLAMNPNKTLLEGHLRSASSGWFHPALVSGTFDVGPYVKFSDVRYSFGAQIYDKQADFDGFFRPLLDDVGDTPTIVLRNCGTRNVNVNRTGTSYQFDVGGFPSGGGPLGVCLYRKGGSRIDCGTFGRRESETRTENETETKIEIETEQVVTVASPARHRELRGGGGAPRGAPKRFPARLQSHSHSHLHSLQPAFDSDDANFLLYALANKTVVDEETGDMTILFASTSVYFEGACQDD
mmetsp:Transcript_21761/g.60420  ORF Transcript_21761/g.60420 Transcript_21761/m.60420 type:complete len:314 (+) Transcript_21761:314-1255(+)